MLLHPVADNDKANSISKINVHSASVTSVIVSPDYKHIFSASSDGSLFIFKICEERINPNQPLAPGDEPLPDPPIQMDPELCQIVLVKRDDMEGWLKRQQKL